jgi:hypothetical protein
MGAPPPYLQVRDGPHVVVRRVVDQVAVDERFKVDLGVFCAIVDDGVLVVLSKPRLAVVGALLVESEVERIAADGVVACVRHEVLVAEVVLGLGRSRRAETLVVLDVEAFGGRGADRLFPRLVILGAFFS